MDSQVVAQVVIVQSWVLHEIVVGCLLTAKVHWPAWQVGVPVS